MHSVFNSELQESKLITEFFRTQKTTETSATQNSVNEQLEACATQSSQRAETIEPNVQVVDILTPMETSTETSKESLLVTSLSKLNVEEVAECESTTEKEGPVL